MAKGMQALWAMVFSFVFPYRQRAEPLQAWANIRDSILGCAAVPRGAQRYAQDAAPVIKHFGASPVFTQSAAPPFPGTCPGSRVKP